MSSAKTHIVRVSLKGPFGETTIDSPPLSAKEASTTANRLNSPEEREKWQITSIVVISQKIL